MSLPVCHHCSTEFFAPENSHESGLLFKVTNATGAQPPIRFYCRSTNDVENRIGEIEYAIGADVKRCQAIWKWHQNQQYRSEGCYDKECEQLEDLADIAWIERERARFQRKHAGVQLAESDYPEELQLAVGSE